MPIRIHDLESDPERVQAHLDHYLMGLYREATSQMEEGVHYTMRLSVVRPDHMDIHHAKRVNGKWGEVMYRYDLYISEIAQSTVETLEHIHPGAYIHIGPEHTVRGTVAEASRRELLDALYFRTRAALWAWWFKIGDGLRWIERQMDRLYMHHLGDVNEFCGRERQAVLYIKADCAAKRLKRSEEPR